MSDAILKHLADVIDSRKGGDTAESYVARGMWLWGRDETLRYYLAGGGDERSFEVCQAAGLALTRRKVAALRGGTFSRSAHGVRMRITRVDRSTPDARGGDVASNR